ncbi:MAG: chemotaxis protein CheW [Ignavibacteria bacterium]
MINILKLRQLEKEKRALAQSEKLEMLPNSPAFEVIDDKSLQEEFPEPEPDILVEPPPLQDAVIDIQDETALNEEYLAEEIMAEETIEIISESDMPAPEQPAEAEIDLMEKLRLELINQIASDPDMATRTSSAEKISETDISITPEVKTRILQTRAIPVVETPEPATEVKRNPIPEKSRELRPHEYNSHDEHKDKKVIESVIQLVGFNIGREYYGIEINRIKEINRMTEITKVPRAPDFIEGVINLRGTVIPVVNLRTKVRMPKVAYDKNTRIIIAELNEKTIGFIVDGVREVLRIPEHLFVPPPMLSIGKKTEYILSVAKFEDDLVILMDPEKLLSNEEIISLK